MTVFNHKRKENAIFQVASCDFLLATFEGESQRMSSNMVIQIQLVLWRDELSRTLSPVDIDPHPLCLGLMLSVLSVASSRSIVCFPAAVLETADH